MEEANAGTTRPIEPIFLKMDFFGRRTGELARDLLSPPIESGDDGLPGTAMTIAPLSPRFTRQTFRMQRGRKPRQSQGSVGLQDASDVTTGAKDLR